ncbi:MAG: carbohydrate ABC transporter permease [Armatimonadota bacterium]
MQRIPTVTKSLIYTVLILLGLTMIVPFVWMLSTSLKEAGEVFTPQLQIIPQHPLWSNYLDSWNAIPFGRMLFNSTLVAVSITAGQLITSSLAAYAFARLRFPGRDILFFSYLATMMVPGVVTMIPTFCLLTIMGEHTPYEFHIGKMWMGNVVGGDSYFALIAPGLFTAYGTFLLRQFFLTIPRDLDEAAMIDGCSKFAIYKHIILPLSGPALATLTIFTFIGSWRDFMWPLIMSSSPDMQTLPVGLATFKSTFGINYNLQMAASIIVMLPMLVVFISNQRFFTEGIKMTGVKG